MEAGVAIILILSVVAGMVATKAEDSSTTTYCILSRCELKAENKDGQDAKDP